MVILCIILSGYFLLVASLLHLAFSKYLPLLAAQSRIYVDHVRISLRIRVTKSYTVVLNTLYT